MRSKEIADLAGVTVRTLRHYRKIGLLREPPRARNGYCEYAAEDLARLLRIKSLAALGFSLDDIAHMIDADGAAGGGATYDEKLEELDCELQAQIRRLEEQRRTVARLRAENISPDMPLRAGRVLRKLADTRLLSDMEQTDETALLLAAHLYADEDFEEIDSFCNALDERGLIDAYRRASRLLEELDDASDEQACDHAASEMVSVLTQVIDCFKAKNWDRPETEAEKIIDSYAQKSLNATQERVADKILGIVYERIMEREALADA